MKTIDISVIIPIYNVEGFLEECLESILCQTIEQNRIEVILVDDGSTDDSGTIASNYAEKYDNFTCIHKENGGLSSARNAGLKKAEGRYIVFLDSDDSLKPHALERLWLEAVQNNADLILFGAENFKESGGTGREIIEETLYKYNYDSIGKGYDLYKQMYFSDDLIISACWVMVCKDLLDRHCIHFIEGIQYEDHWYNFLVLLYAHRAIVVNLSLYNRRLQAGSIIAENNHTKKFQGMLATLKGLDELSRKDLPWKRKKAVELEIVRISGHAINALVRIEDDKIDKNQLQIFRLILLKHRFWMKGCLTATALFGIKAGIWFRKHFGKQ